MKRFGLYTLLLAMLIIGGERGALSQSDPNTGQQDELERLRKEMFELQNELHETRAQLYRIQRIYGLERYRFPQKIKLFDQEIPVHRSEIWERMDRDFLLAVHNIPQVLLWIKRANRYFPMIEQRLKAGGLPDDLKYVAIVESALRPRARSHAGAMGIWQFMIGTGSRYRLQRNQWVDERQDPVKSTEAALTYLKDLHEMFGDWFLAVAAYNVGEERLQKALERQQVDSYFDLVLPAETERYVFRIASAKVILKAPKTYGFELLPEDLYDPLQTMRIIVQVKRGELDLVALARACGMTYRDFKGQNPHFRGALIPQGQYAMYVPLGKIQEARQFIDQWNGTPMRVSSPMPAEEFTHRVLPGETLSDIASKYNIQVSALQQWNGLDNANQIYVGQRLYIFSKEDTGF